MSSDNTLTKANSRAPRSAVQNKQTAIKAHLSAIDWNFQDRSSKRKVESIHPYPAKFIPDIPGRLLEALPVPSGTTVFDPFCGSGTTLVESQRLGIPSIGVDLNPIACLMARVKTQALPRGIEAVAEGVIKKASSASSRSIPNIPNLDHWFSKAVQKAIAALREEIETVAPRYKDILNLALSSIIVRVSNQESDTRYAAIAKNVKGKEVFSAFSSAVEKTILALKEREYSLTQSRVIQSDTLKLKKKDFKLPVSLVITSPPYPNAYEYWLYHKYRMWWLDHDPLEVKENEIGARAHFFKKNHHTADDFVRQMSKTFALFNKIMVPNGYAAFIVGRSKIHGRIIDNAQIIQNVAEGMGFSSVFKTERIIAQNRKSFNLSHANIKTETVLVLQKSE